MINQNDSLEAPRNVKQVYNRQYMSKKKGSNQEEVNKKNQADEIQTVMSMCGQHPMVQHVGIMPDKSPTVILYTQDNMDDNIQC